MGQLMTLRPLSAEDLAQVVALEAANQPRPFSSGFTCRAQVVSCLTQPSLAKRSASF